MKKQRNVGKMLVIGTIILALFVAIMFVILFNNWLNGEGEETVIDQATEEKMLAKIHKTNFYENGWDRKIVAQIVEDEVPVPAGFEFVSGTKETGLIIKDTNTNLELMWIPYDEIAKLEGIEEYYKNVDYTEIDSETLDSIEKYGGFYVSLEEQNQYETLKQVDNESYQKAVEEASKLYEGNENVNSNLLSLTELQQVLVFANKNGISVTQTSLENNMQYNVSLTFGKNSTVTKTATNTKNLGLISVNIESYSDVEDQDAKYDKDYISQKVRVKVKNQIKYIPIPKGYEYMTKTTENSKNKEIIKIKDKKHKHLVYVWVPVNEKESVDSLENAKDALNKLYEQYNVINNWPGAEDPTETTAYKKMLASVKEYGGFYISEAELGYDDAGNYYNKARGMTDSLVNKGEYYRTIENENIKAEMLAEESGLDKNENGYYLTYEKAKEIIKEVNNPNKSTVSHLTYGAEWDAVMLWIMKTNKAPQEYPDIIKNIIQTSLYMPGAKYKNRMNDAEGLNIADEDISKINGIYGLAGNLCDLTQESIVENGITYRILRGGSFTTAGNEYPMAARARIDSLEYNDIGFRSCMYIKSEKTENIEIEEIENKWSGEVATNFSGGNGTQNNPYLIESGEQLAYLAKIVNNGDTCNGKYYQIIKDIDLDNKKWTPIGKDSYTFKGVLNGNGNSIIGLNVTEKKRAGLIGDLSGNGIVKNLTIESGYVVAIDERAGGIVGCAQGAASILECTNKCKIESNVKHAGGIAGTTGEKVVINNCTNMGEIVAGIENAGGIVGHAGYNDLDDDYKVSGCINIGKVITNKYCGGIVGYASEKGTIQNCINKGELVCYEMAAREICGDKEDTVTVK